MIRRLLRHALLLASVVLSAQPASAALIDRGGGMIYDTDANLTWLQDWNYARTSGYDADGFMDWPSAVKWAEQLEFGGYTDWRLPHGVLCGGCTGLTEFMHLWVQELENFSLSINPGPFINLSTSGIARWTGTDLAGPSALLFGASRSGAYIGDSLEFNEYFAVAVREGDVRQLPEPGPIALLALATGAFVASRRVAGARGVRTPED